MFYNYSNLEEIQRWTQIHILRNPSEFEDMALYWTEAKEFLELRDEYVRWNNYKDWNVSLGDTILISYPKIQQVQTSLCIYPIQYEQEMKNAVCSRKFLEVKKSITSFEKYFNQGKVYEPTKIKECFIRFYFTLINLAREIGLLDKHSIEEQLIFENIMKARTRSELQATSDIILELINTKNQMETHLRLHYKLFRNCQ